VLREGEERRYGAGQSLPMCCWALPPAQAGTGIPERVWQEAPRAAEKVPAAPEGPPPEIVELVRVGRRPGRDTTGRLADALRERIARSGLASDGQTDRAVVERNALNGP